jgi:hypothetical protein
LELSSLVKLWPTHHDGRKIARIGLFSLLLNFFSVNFESSNLVGKTVKAVLLIGDRLSEKVRLAFLFLIVAKIKWSYINF